MTPRNSYVQEITTWYTNITMLQNHARTVRACTTTDERARMPDLHRPLIENLIWAMEEASNSLDPLRQSRWYMYQNCKKLRPADYEVEGLVPVSPLALMEMEPL